MIFYKNKLYPRKPSTQSRYIILSHNSSSIVGLIGISLNERVSNDIYSDGGHNLINKAGPSRHFNATPGIGSDNGS